ncbi:VCBS domain-containing protein [uncultured Reyranella sp.]|jgi:VCBS repeat-containing protein|uniref:VCBS domain-containing protein n=1 Tax=uncultured Reyranella sp. TaxID=735512 RepID=UPI00259C96B8|nr:VCBS domain-containing protein [uncultured Reyranella sp.]
MAASSKKANEAREQHDDDDHGGRQPQRPNDVPERGDRHDDDSERGGTPKSFVNAPQAKDDAFSSAATGITENSIGIYRLDVMRNDLGGSAKKLWSLDNGVNNTGALNGYVAGDLLVQDTARSQAGSSDTSLNGARIWITTDGQVGYDASTLSPSFRVQLQALNDGQSLTDSFTYAIRLANGALSWATATVQFAGSNDAAVISGVTSGTVTEAGGVANAIAGLPTVTGILTATDADNAANSFQAVTAETFTAGGYGSYTLTAGGAWTYTLDNANTAVQSLNAGQHLTDTFTVRTIDGTAEQVTVTIDGTNDAAVLSSAVANLTETDSATDLSTSGTLTVSDIDSAAAFVAQSATAGAYGTFAIDAAGAWTYTATSAHDEFVAGQTYTDSFVVTSADGTATSVTVNILGTDDVAVISGVVTGAVVEAGSDNDGGTPVAIGILAAADVDSAPNSFLAVATATASDNGYGAYTAAADGTWTYTLDNGNAAVEALGAGDTLTDFFTVLTVDGTAQQVAVTINGAADGPVNHAPVANDDILNSVVTFEPGTYSESRLYDDSLGYYRSYVDTTEGYRFADNGGGNYRLGDYVEGPSITVYEGVDYSYALYNYGAEGAPYDTVTHNMPIEMTRMDGGVFVLARANIVGYDAYYKSAVLTETVTGYLNGVQGVTLTFDLPNTVDVTVSHTHTVDLSGLGMVDRVEFVTEGTNNSSYNYNHTFIDNIEIVQSLTNEDTPVQIASATLLANDTDADNGHVLHVGSVSATSALGAAVSIDGNGVITYDPTVSSVLGALGENEFANDSFTYTAVDEHGASSQATASLRVAGAADGSVNHAPTVADSLNGGTIYVWAGADIPNYDGGGPGYNFSPDAPPAVVHSLDNATDADNDPLSVASYEVVVGNYIGMWVDNTYYGIDSSQAISFDAVANVFRLDPNAYALQGLHAGESATLTVAYNVSDGQATTPDSISWTLVGTDDASLVGQLLIA